MRCLSTWCVAEFCPKLFSDPSHSSYYRVRGYSDCVGSRCTLKTTSDSLNDFLCSHSTCRNFRWNEELENSSVDWNRRSKRRGVVLSSALLTLLFWSGSFPLPLLRTSLVCRLSQYPFVRASVTEEDRLAGRSVGRSAVCRYVSSCFM